jgi:hypothetical protein
MVTLPDWLPLSPAARRRAWEVAQAAPLLNEETLSAVALLVRPDTTQPPAG